MRGCRSKHILHTWSMVICSPRGVSFCVVFGSWTVFPLTVVHLDPSVQLHAHMCARNGVIFRKDLNFFASLALSTLCVFCMGPRWGLKAQKLKKNYTKS